MPPQQNVTMTPATTFNSFKPDIPVPPLADQRHLDKASFITPSVLKGFARVMDLILTGLLGWVIATLYVDEPSVATNAAYLTAIMGTALATMVLLQALRVYDALTFSSILKLLPRVVLGWSLAFGLLIAVMFFLKAGPVLSRGWMLLWFSTGLGALVAVRLVLASFVRRWAAKGRLNRRAIIFGAGELTDDIIRQLESDSDTDIRIAGIFDDRGTDRLTSETHGYPHLGTLNDLVAFCRDTRVDLIIVTLPVAAEARFVDVMRQLSLLPADVKLPAAATQIRFPARTYSHVGPVAMIDIADKPIAGWGTIAKWLFDKVIATAALIALAPVMAAVAVAIRLDSKGPVIFRQKRYGFNNELIEVFKFRSMYTDRCDAAAAKLVTKDDARVTPVGRFIRKTSLDELPQLFNVLMGNLSLVGPRPHALQAKAEDRLYDDVVDGYFARHKVKPGITGWAQINGWRGETDTAEKIEKRVEHDLYYIENWSLLLDLYILAKTPQSLLKSDNAY